MEKLLEFAEKEKLRNPFKEDKNFESGAAKVMEEVENIETTFNDESKTIKIESKKEDSILALEIASVYSRNENTVVYINDKKNWNK